VAARLARAKGDKLGESGSFLPGRPPHGFIKHKRGTPALTTVTYICARRSQIGVRRARLRRISPCAVQHRVFVGTTTAKRLTS
jgi:hypothetical protein